MKIYTCKLMIFLWVIGGLLVAGCERKEVMEYEGVDGIYFDVQYGASHGNESYGPARITRTFHSVRWKRRKPMLR